MVRDAEGGRNKVCHSQALTANQSWRRLVVFRCCFWLLEPEMVRDPQNGKSSRASRGCPSSPWPVAAHWNGVGKSRVDRSRTTTAAHPPATTESLQLTEAALEALPLGLGPQHTTRCSPTACRQRSGLTPSTSTPADRSSLGATTHSSSCAAPSSTDCRTTWSPTAGQQQMANAAEAIPIPSLQCRCPLCALQSEPIPESHLAG